MLTLLAMVIIFDMVHVSVAGTSIFSSFRSETSGSAKETVMEFVQALE